MSCSKPAHGVQVVTVGDDGLHHVCSEALRSVLTRAELSTLPVAVVSVAGATRGGKSFLLDFFLRYLGATPSARSDGSWLGAEDEPLGGFSWRGGCERDTLGIQLWSEPFLLTRENGEKVVVLLMDTQGTFDSNSTIRDSTTIFAMSTLLSSVQIFNISMNIQEDHLQYLQLFTEYGKLAKEGTGTPFQVLQFLVRDWSYGYQHPVGADGGQQLLEKRLQVHDSQAEELKEVRQHIQASFESVKCFLMPHPGLTVATSPNFVGCLADISKEFRASLLELVQNTFEQNLTLKKINGQEIQVQELVEYFESYMEVFKSDELPTPVTILTATNSAYLQVALNVARVVYVTHMEHSNEERSVPRDVIPRQHAAAKEAARQAFVARRTLATPERVAEQLDRLLKDLDDLLANYVKLNETKTQAAITASKAAYEKHMMNVVECLLLNEMEERHCESVEQAIELFDTFRVKQEDGEDEVRRDLQEELVNFLELHEQIMQRNEAKINAAIADAFQTYKGALCRAAADTVLTLCMLPNHLLTLHRAAKVEALTAFESRWKSQESAQNEHMTALCSQISERFLEISSLNEANNANAVLAAVTFYEDTMNDILGADLCLHPLDLQSEHNKLYDSSITKFFSLRTHGEQGPNERDNSKLQLVKKLIKCHTHFTSINVKRNKKAVKDVHNFYELRMNIGRAAGVPEFVLLPDFDIFQRHEITKPLAINMFENERRRRGPRRHANDPYLDELNSLIEESYKWLIVKLLGMGILAIGSLAWFRRLL